MCADVVNTVAVSLGTNLLSACCSAYLFTKLKQYVFIGGIC